MDILLFVIISAMAVGYVTEFVGALLKSFFNPLISKHVLTAPLSYAACWYLNITGFELVIAGLATAFLATATTAIVNRVLEAPVVVDRSLRR